MSRSARGASSPASTHRSTGAAGSLRGKAARTAANPPKGPSVASRSRASKGPSAGSVQRRNRNTPAAEQRAARRRPAPFIPGPNRRGRRLAPAYDLEGPRVRLGVAWFVVVFVALGLGRALGDFPLVGVVYAATATVAAAQIVDAWSPKGPKLLRSAAMAVAAVVALSASFGAAVLGGAILLGVVVGIVVGVGQILHRRPVLPATALLLQAALPTGLVAASVVLTMRYEIGACVILLAMVMAFDLGDFLIGSGAGSLIEGPIAGSLMIGIVAAVVAIIEAPPFHGASVWLFAFGAMVACPAGQVAASWLLPDATTRASALRRMDSLLVLGPIWAFATGLLVAHA